MQTDKRQPLPAENQDRRPGCNLVPVAARRQYGCSMRNPEAPSEAGGAQPASLGLPLLARCSHIATLHVVRLGCDNQQPACRAHDGPRA